jgi:putative ABC transport system ATP-binding protein
MIDLIHVSKSFPAPRGGAVNALDRLNLHVARGEFVAIVGASGSGKSTLLFSIGGLSAPTSGRVSLGGKSIYDLGPAGRAALRRTEVGFVFQTFNLVPYLTTLENVLLPGLLAGRSRTEASESAARLLDSFGLGARLHHRPAQLSVGERQRAAVARGLVNAPTVLLADEPTGNLDPDSAAQVMELFERLHAGGQTIVMVTHDPQLAERAGRVVRLHAGAIQEDRPGRSRRLAS